MSCHFESPLILPQFSSIVLMVEGSAIIVCHQPDGFCVVWMSIFGETGNAAWAMQALMLSAVTDFWVPQIIRKLVFESGEEF